jgi:hypothetical protein
MVNEFVGKKMGGESNRSSRSADKSSGSQTGAFVYQGSGKKHRAEADLSEVKCEKQTLAVQWCLAKNDHQQKRCQGMVDALVQCKEHWDAKDPKLQAAKKAAAKM